MKPTNLIFEPITILGLTPLDVMALFLLGIIVIIAVGVFAMYKQPPYRIKLVRGNDSESIWALEHKEQWFALEWEEVCRDKDVSIIKSKAKEALHAHYHFYAFLNKTDPTT